MIRGTKQECDFVAIALSLIAISFYLAMISALFGPDSFYSDTDDSLWPGFGKTLELIPMLLAVIGHLAIMRAETYDDLHADWRWRYILEPSMSLCDGKNMGIPTA